MGSCCAGPERQHQSLVADHKAATPYPGIQPCCSGLQVQGTANSPPSTALFIILIYILKCNGKSYTFLLNISVLTLNYFLLFFCLRISLKKFVSIVPHSSASTPLVTLDWRLKRFSLHKFMSVPVQPAFGSLAPYTIRVILDCTISPAHIGQGSSVTYYVKSYKR